MQREKPGVPFRSPCVAQQSRAPLQPSSHLVCGPPELPVQGIPQVASSSGIRTPDTLGARSLSPLSFYSCGSAAVPPPWEKDTAACVAEPASTGTAKHDCKAVSPSTSSRSVLATPPVDRRSPRSLGQLESKGHSVSGIQRLPLSSGRHSFGPAAINGKINELNSDVPDASNESKIPSLAWTYLQDTSAPAKQARQDSIDIAQSAAGVASEPLQKSAFNAFPDSYALPASEGSVANIEALPEMLVPAASALGLFFFCTAAPCDSSRSPRAFYTCTMRRPGVSIRARAKSQVCIAIARI